MLRFEDKVLDFACEHRMWFRPGDVIVYFREHMWEKFPASGGPTTEVYCAIYALVQKGKLARKVFRKRAKRDLYMYRRKL